MNFVCSSGFCWWWCLEMRTLNRSDQGLKAYSCLNLCAQGPFLALLGDHVCCGGCIPLQLCARKERYPLYDLVPTMDSKWNQRRSSFSADILVDIYLREFLFQTVTWEGWETAEMYEHCWVWQYSPEETWCSTHLHFTPLYC